jgi:hypothetical protein
MYQALQYPSFEPSQRWLRSSLLFYDTIYCIAPEKEAGRLWSNEIVNLMAFLNDDAHDKGPPKSARPSRS